MENPQKTRLIILAVSGVLLSGAGYFYWDHNNKKAEQAVTEEVDIPIKAAVHKNPPVATATTTAVGSKPVAAPQTASGTTPGAKPAVAPPAVATANGAKTSANAAATPAGKTDGAAVKPVVAIAPAVPAVKPVAINPAVNIRPAVAPVAAPKVGAPTAPAIATKPTAAAVIAAKPPVAAPTTKPTPVAQTPSFPNGPRLAPTTPAPVAATPAAQPNSLTAAAIGAPAAPANKHAATTFAEAIAAAKTQEGRNDPMQPLASFLPFPHGAKAEVPPPPPNAEGAEDGKAPSAGALKGAAAVAKKNIDKLVPPPPPADATGGGGAIGELPITELPVPPSRPTIGDKLKVLAILDDRAVVAFPTDMRIKNKWPKTIRLGTGEEFESIKVVGVSKDGVTIEEDGERTLKPLSTVK